MKGPRQCVNGGGGWPMKARCQLLRVVCFTRRRRAQVREVSVGAHCRTRGPAAPKSRKIGCETLPLQPRCSMEDSCDPRRPARHLRASSRPSAPGCRAPTGCTTSMTPFASTPTAPRAKGGSRTEPHFDDRRGETERLTVDADDCPGLLLAITTALFLERVSIWGSEVLTDGGRAHDEFDLLEWDGSHLSRERKAAIVARVAAAIAAMG